MSNTNNKPISFLSNAETDRVSRALLAWLNEYPDKPVNISFEGLRPDTVGIALSTIQGAYKTRQYITGGYEAQYQFKLIYRLQPSDSNDRLAADELLNAFGDWAAQRPDKPDIGAGNVLRIECNTRSSLFAVYEDGSADHQILLTMTYEVI